MKKMIFALTLFASVSCFAENYHVPMGYYTGRGKWTDNFGQSGTWTMSIHLTENSDGGYHEEFTSQMSDGRQYAGAADFIFGANSYFTYVANINGNPVTIGHGVSAPGSYTVMDLALNENEWITEFGSYKRHGPWKRRGTLFDRTTGRATQYEITEFRVGNHP